MIKLVIWDLDDTLWKGTLSEGEVRCDNSNYIIELAKHGIMNSISSKNNYDNAKQKLEEYGVWNYFIFPSINWNPKGLAVKQIIDDCQLRSENVIFVDDNHQNRKEVEYYNPSIIVLSSFEEVTNYINLDDYKLDPQLTRLEQYKLLERKHEYKTTCKSNYDFLVQSNIRIKRIHENQAIKERLSDLIARTNQLNYTKKRISSKELDELLSDNNFRCEAIQVTDDFGDYGICGFYAINVINNTLEHFLFSCRILNLGVENYIYQQLGRPNIDIIEPVATNLTEEQITWIKEIDDIDTNTCKENIKKINIALVGGCDLEQLCHYLPNKKFNITKDFNYVNSRGIAVHREHTTFIRKAVNNDKHELEFISKLPFLDKNILNFKFLDDNIDYIIFSPLMNYTQELYNHNNLNYMIAYGGYSDIHNKDKVKGFDDNELYEFKCNWSHKGQQSPADFEEDLKWLISVTSKLIIFLNGAEVAIENPQENDAHLRHIEMNKVLEKFVNAHPNRCSMIDVRKYVLNRDDLTNNIRHYQRHIYIELAKEVIGLTTREPVKISRGLILKRQLFYKLLDLKSFIFKFIKR